MLIKKLVFVPLAIVLLSFSVSIADDFSAGVSAYDNGDYKAAIKLWKPLAEQGDALAQNILGLMYRKGQGVPEDDKEAVKWFRLAAEQGDAGAQYNLGLMYDNGEGVLQDYKQTFKWYRLAAEQGYAKAQNNLGTMYGNGKGVPQDDVIAYLWWNLAAAEGHNSAINNRDIISKRMTSEQIAEAQRLSRECLKKEYKNCY